MIDDLDKTLERLLRHELPTNLVGEHSISFASPDTEFPPTSVTLPAGQKIAVGGTGLTLAKLISAKKLLDAADIDK